MATAHRAYLSLLAGAFMLLCLGLALFNFRNDPYSVFADHYSPSRYGARPQTAQNSRLERIAGIIRRKPSMIVLGSSIVNNGMYRGAPEVEAVLRPYPDLYDAGVNGGSVEDVMLLYTHALANNPSLKTVIIGIDLFKLGSYGHSIEQIAGYDLDALAGRRHLPVKVTLQLLLGGDTAAASLQMLPLVRDLKARYESYFKEPASGNIAVPPPLVEKDPETTASIAYTQKESFLWKTSPFKEGDPGYERNFQSAATLKMLKDLVDSARRQGITVHCFVHASPAIRWAGLGQAGYYGWYENVLRKLVAITPLLDFSIYAPFYFPAAPDAHYFNGDNIHYPPVTGAFILHKILSGDVADVTVTRENLESHLAQSRAVIARWKAQNPRVVAALARTLPEEREKRAGPWDGPLLPAGIEDYRGFAVYRYINTYYALPYAQAPFSFLAMLLGEYAPMPVSSSLETLKAGIDVQYERGNMN